MENPELLKQVEAKAQVWLGEAYDEATRKEVKRMLEADDKTELIDAFYRDLEFGTGGLRGIMGRLLRVRYILPAALSGSYLAAILWWTVPVISRNISG